MSRKTLKALSKRIKISGNNKLSHLKANQRHFSAKDTGKITRGTRQARGFSQPDEKVIRKMLN